MYTALTNTQVAELVSQARHPLPIDSQGPRKSVQIKNAPLVSYVTVDRQRTLRARSQRFDRMDVVATTDNCRGPKTQRWDGV